jgi:NAD(P)-dependent dehydrogenase (short-subunit alcohol dehydrogenase family)
MKNFLVIGGSSGIGKSLVDSLAQAGNQVYATYNQHPQEQHAKVHYSFLNVLDQPVKLDYLPEKLDGLAYCPGSINLRPFTRLSTVSFEEDYKLQVLGAVSVLQEVLPNLKSAERASLVFFSTVAVQMGFNFHAQVATSKGAIEGLTRSLAAELAPNIRVNAIAPSITDTPLATKLLADDKKKEANRKRHPLQRIGHAKDISDMAAFLLSDKSSWMTGQIIHIDGGISSIK